MAAAQSGGRFGHGEFVVYAVRRVSLRVSRLNTEAPPLLLPPYRQRPLQLLQHHPLVRPPAQDRLDDFWREHQQP